MTRGVRLYVVGSFVLVSLAGCGRGFFSEEREPWRTEAEIACLKSGAVKENAELVRMSPISGPGVCGAEFPLKVAALGESSGTFGFADEDLRPPANVGNQPRWPIGQPAPAPPPPQTPYYPDGGQRAPGLRRADLIECAGHCAEPGRNQSAARGCAGVAEPGRARTVFGTANLSLARPLRPAVSGARRYALSATGAKPAAARPRARRSVGAFGPVAVRPAATLACPIVSVLDRWLAEAVQPAAQRWFGTRVVEIKQISAYSCRGMNGNSFAHISEHAFGNALDIAGFTLADGRHVTVKDGWRGLPEEQGFLRDIEAAACQQFTTVLAPGSNVYHYDHIHVDLMRRASRRLICEPAAVSGEEVAARAAQRNPYASRGPFVTGALGGRKVAIASAQARRQGQRGRRVRGRLARLAVYRFSDGLDLRR